MNNIVEILKHCEENGPAPKYVVQDETYQEEKSGWFKKYSPKRTKPVKFNSENEEIFVVSDLHIGSGRDDAGVYPGTENFFADDSFKKFLNYLNKSKSTDKALLIINGDIFDFLRITEFPGKIRKVRLSKRLKHYLKFNPLPKPKSLAVKIIRDQFEDWSNELKKIGIDKSADELGNCISDKEKKYGLRTDHYKTIFKLMLIRNGHPVFFRALAEWLKEKNKIIIVKGNHDLELFWFEVRNYLRLILAEEIKNDSQNDLGKILVDDVLPNITFIDDSVEIDEDFYVEHGHRYDKFCAVLDDPVLDKDKSQINIPFGSFFNRYLINRVELFYPFLDNVRPSDNILPILMKENFALGLKILFQHIPALGLILFKNFRYLRFMIGKVFLFVLAIILPIAVLVLFQFDLITSFVTKISDVIKAGGIAGIIINYAQNILMIFLSYLLARLAAWFQLSEPSSLNGFAKKRFEGTDYKIMTMGHTHNPGEYSFDGDRRFYNTGTWIPIIETSTADIREDKTYTFLHLKRDENNKLVPAENGLLQRWNDDANYPENLILIKRK
jgi:UDP-2,3-diacylglucosamine pyrophosphatase LpxH